MRGFKSDNKGEGVTINTPPMRVMISFGEKPEGEGQRERRSFRPKWRKNTEGRREGGDAKTGKKIAEDGCLSQ